jgi:8-oxo-dGTP pyrophosphatase MutT (NUDIX family)
MILLLQRAADEDVLPNLYELPGGNWEETNDTIPDTAAREVEESTALVMSAVVRI